MIETLISRVRHEFATNGFLPVQRNFWMGDGRCCGVGSILQDRPGSTSWDALSRALEAKGVPVSSDEALGFVCGWDGHPLINRNPVIDEAYKAGQDLYLELMSKSSV